MINIVCTTIAINVSIVCRHLVVTTFMYVVLVTNNGMTLQDLLKEPFKYLRMCTLSIEDLCKDVFLTKTLTGEEVLMIMESVVKNTVVEDLSTVCNTLQTRNLTKKCIQIQDECQDIVIYVFLIYTVHGCTLILNRILLY